VRRWKILKKNNQNRIDVQRNHCLDITELLYEGYIIQGNYTSNGFIFDRCLMDKSGSPMVFKNNSDWLENLEEHL